MRSKDRIGKKVLATGVDTLVVGFGVNEFMDSECWEVLKAGKVEAQSGGSIFNKGLTDIDFNGKPFELASRGSKGYEWILNNGDLSMLIAKEARGGTVYPECYITFRAEYLWRVGADRAFIEVSDWLSGFMNMAFDKISRADLAVDLDMALPDIDMFKDVVSQSRNKQRFSEVREFAKDSRMTGYWFGSGDLIGRIYDKSLETIKTGDKYMLPVWEGHGWNGVSPVARLEFQSRRDKLKEFGVNSYADLRDLRSDMWRYYTTKSLRICDRGSETHQARWDVKPYWKDYQEAGGRFGEAQGIMPFKESKANSRMLIRQGLGCFESAYARVVAIAGEDRADGLMEVASEFMNSEEFMVEASKHINRYKRFSVAEQEAVDDGRG